MTPADDKTVKDLIKAVESYQEKQEEHTIDKLTKFLPSAKSFLHEIIEDGVNAIKELRSNNPNTPEQSANNPDSYLHLSVEEIVARDNAPRTNAPLLTAKPQQSVAAQPKDDLIPPSQEAPKEPEQKNEVPETSKEIDPNTPIGSLYVKIGMAIRTINARDEKAVQSDMDKSASLFTEANINMLKSALTPDELIELKKLPIDNNLLVDIQTNLTHKCLKHNHAKRYIKNNLLKLQKML